MIRLLGHCIAIPWTPAPETTLVTSTPQALNGNLSLRSARPGEWSSRPPPRVSLGAATSAAAGLSPKEANDTKHIREAAHIPVDIDGCVRVLLQDIVGAGVNPAFEAHLCQQVQTLRKHGIDDKHALCDMLDKARMLDTLTATAHGIAAGGAFNAGSAVLNFAPGEALFKAIGKAVAPTAQAVGQSVGEAMAPMLSAMVTAVAQGVAAGLLLSLVDAASGPAVAKTFRDAYYSRPPEDQLAPWIEPAHPRTRLSTAKEVAVAIGAGYGGRNVLVRMPLQSLPAQQAAMADAYADPLGGIAGSAVVRHLLNHFDVRAGRAGNQFLLARNDLDECLQAMKATPREQAMAALMRAGDHARHIVTEMPKAMKAIVSEAGLVSHALVGAGFAAVGATSTIPLAPSVAALGDAGARVVGVVSKFGALQAVYVTWGAVMGAMGVPRKKPEPVGENIV
jgi:hypothetical protein